MNASDLSAVCGALLRLRPRARAGKPGEKHTLPAHGALCSWVIVRAARGTEYGEEWIGVERAEDDATDDFARLVAAHLPDELIPSEMRTDGRRLVLKMRTRARRVRCRDCGWNEASDYKQSLSGFCTECSERRRIGIWGFGTERTEAA